MAWVSNPGIIYSILVCTDNMVVISSKESYCHGIMLAMNQLRLEDRLCDVTLVVGDHTVSAHRCVLVAGSDYFKSRFTGPFKTDNLPQVDLTPITHDISAVKLMLNFLYTGEISIDSENLEPILKVSSFFMLSELRAICIDFMEKNLNLDTYMKYFLLSVDHMIPEIEKKIVQTVKSRFHDYFIFEEQCVEITPDQLLYLIQNCQIFDNCTNEDILVFLFNWVQSGKSEAHELLGCDILELVCTRARKIQSEEHLNRNFSKSFKNFKSSIDLNESKSVFMIKLRKVIAKHFSDQKADVKVLRPLSSRSPKPAKLKDLSDTENVLITISPKSRVVTLIEKESDSLSASLLKAGDAVFDICVFIPRTQTWYYMHEGKLEGIFDQIYIEELDWMYCLTRDKLCCVFPYGDTIETVSLSDFTWSSVDYLNVETNQGDAEMTCHDYCLCSDRENQALFLLLRVNVFDNADRDDLVQIYLKCFRLTPENTWAFMFNTPRIDTDDQFGAFVAVMSSKSNEMIISYDISDELHVFVVEMDTDHTQSLNIYHEKVTDKAVMKGQVLHILKSKDHFHLMTVLFCRQGPTKIACLFKYRFKSRQLIPVQNMEYSLDEKTLPYEESKQYPCSYQFHAGDKQGLWIFAGTREKGSTLIEVFLDNKERLTSRVHKPPPFSCVTALVAGEVNAECLTSLKPVTKYMGD